MDPLLNDLDFKFDPNDIDQDDEDEVAFAMKTTLGNGGGIFNTDNLNPYSYGYNDPVRFEDPDGRCPICVFVVAALVFSEFANAPTGNAKVDTRNYNASKSNKTLVSSAVLAGGTRTIAKSLLSNSTEDKVKTVVIDADKHPESAKHLGDAIKEGKSNVGKVDRKGASTRRGENLKGTKAEKGKDRDEAPPAVINTGEKASVRKIDPSDNRGAGASIGHQLKDVPDGTPVRIIPINLPKK
ncbi:NucA/NucB deoxyribonuclease domain-containing protein [Flavobacterium sp. TR2]|uniref:NucA/NucB deoxyribonuclease domain-containing protein n=1 Tax=Flavobacterium sp. TR2 TaxID=2977321 RepID=UPI0021B0ED1A|nr:NucA/NucB deoxyribonuclease domain-containing protein [Flavobacterium sp. TR2]UWY30123.1 NucA/NucB deoxyribonuclease domain-containing protein [Flavobacterium sp. TR2]